MAFNILPTGMSFQRLGNFPLDSSTVHNTLAEAMDYVMNNPTAYPGQIIYIADARTEEEIQAGVEASESLYMVAANKELKLVVSKKDLDMNEMVQEVEDKVAELKGDLDETVEQMNGAMEEMQQVADQVHTELGEALEKQAEENQKQLEEMQQIADQVHQDMNEEREAMKEELEQKLQEQQAEVEQQLQDQKDDLEQAKADMAKEHELMREEAVAKHEAMEAKMAEEHQAMKDEADAKHAEIDKAMEEMDLAMADMREEAEAKHAEIDKAIEDMKAEADAKHVEMEEAAKARHEEMEKEVDVKFAALEKFKISNCPEGTLIDYREKEIRVMCPKDAEFVQQQVGEGGNPNMYYMTFTVYAPEGAVALREGDRGIITDEVIELKNVDKHGRKFKNMWLALASFNGTNWNYFGKTSSLDKYIGWNYVVEFLNEEGKVIATDSIRINLSNEDCHFAVQSYYGFRVADKAYVDEQIDSIAHVLDKDIVVNGGAVGGLQEGLVLKEGTSITDLIEMLLTKANPVEYIKPELEIMVEPEMEQEVGSIIQPVIDYKFVQNDAGEEMEVIYGPVNNKEQGDVKVKDGVNSELFVEVKYAQGKQKVNNLGQECGEPIPEGSIKKVFNFVGYRNMFFGGDRKDVACATSAEVRALEGKEKVGVKEFNFVVPAGSQRVTIAIPQGNNVKEIQYLEQGCVDYKDMFDEEIIQVSGVVEGEEIMDYMVMTYIFAIPCSAKMTFKVVLD